MDSDYDVAIVGMSCRLPGARDVDEFWRNLAGGVESISRLSDDEILASGVPPAYLDHPNYVKAAPVLEDPGNFDASFFGFSPTEAKCIDPQHRILLELAHEALESAGCDPDRYAGRIGVYTGSALNTYFLSVGLNNRLAEDYIPTLIGNDKDFLSTRISYKLNLRGPSVTVQTACSTSAVAIHLARQSLLSHETDLVLAGAISIRVPHRAGYFCDAGGIVSPDGHVRAFDIKANGTVFGSGGAILVMKRLTDAVVQGDTIRAVIKGSAVNNDGALKAGYTAPSVDSQADAVVEALSNAGVEADDISYIEAHGSGTPVGDPIEVRALIKAFRSFTQRSGYCAIGSVKTNVGHLDAAAAVTGILKTTLALQHRMLPPSLHFEQPNPELDLPASPFYVNTQLRDWISEGPRRAGVMSTGMGGTNAHIVLEEAPETPARTVPEPPYLLVLSAKTETALDRATVSLQTFIQSLDTLNMADVTYTLQTGRKAFGHRRFLVCVDRNDAVAGLASKRLVSGQASESRRPIVFLLPGIGDHYVGMAHGLYEACEVFREEVDRCSKILETHLGVDIRTIIYPPRQTWKQKGVGSKGIDLKKMLRAGTDAASDPDVEALNTTLFAQPALFTIECAIARLWHSLGVVPDAIVGHSMGEYLASYLAGVMSLEDALGLIATRAKLVNELPRGSMLAVALCENELLACLPDTLSIALINAPDLCVIAGPVADVSDFESALTSRGVLCRRVQNAHAFHSRMLDPIIDVFEREVAKIRLQEPKVKYTSNVSGKWITAREAMTPAYWSAHANHTARFNEALRELWQFDDPILLEVGPGRTLGVLAMQHPDRRQAGDLLVASSLGHHYENESDVAFFLKNIGTLWSAGVEIKWDGLYANGRPRRIALPTYPFERQHYWIENPQLESRRDVASASPLSTKASIEDWFYVPSWERTPFPSEISSGAPETASTWLVFADRWGRSLHVEEMLAKIGATPRVVRFGVAFARRSDGSFQINASDPDDYLALFQELNKALGTSLNIVHFGCLTADKSDPLRRSTGTDEQDFGFFSVLYMAQAIGELGITTPVRVAVVSNRIHEVTGTEPLDPAMATVLGACGVIPKEFPNITCFNVDLSDPQVAENPSDDVIASILSEFAKPDAGAVLAYRGKHRWKRRYEQVKLGPPPTSKAPSAPAGRLRDHGVYLITGGTGGLGLAFAKYLAKNCHARIALTKKTAFPAKSTWKALLTSRETPEPILSTIKELQEVERLGGEVELFVAEASDHSQMQSVVDEIVARFDTINGVFHAAGIVRAGLVQAKTKQVAASVLAPKVEGTRVLFDVLKDMPLDFAVLFSSVSSITTPYAHVDYSAANCFLDAFAPYLNSQRRFHTVAISWPVWKEVGVVSRLESLLGAEALKEQALEGAILTKDGLDAFTRALNANLSHIIVSPENLERLVKEATIPPQRIDIAVHADAGAGIQPAGGRGEGGPCNDEIESTIGSIWTSVLGLETVGFHDNFAQLGGHSLLAMQIVAKLRSSFQIRITLREFFEAPTIAQLASIVRRRAAAGAGVEARAQPPNLFSPMGQRFFSSALRQTALFLGSDSKQIFAVYHPAMQDGSRVLTVICPPLFNEYMRTQLALRELGISLAEKGQHVVRFDYRGTGDSSGDLCNVSVSDWIDDIELAVREGRELSGSTTVRLLAVRAGALIACRGAIARNAVERLVLWDPVPDGATYLRRLRLIQEEIFARDPSLSETDLKESLHDYGGYRLSEQLAQEFLTLDGSVYSSVENGKLRVISTSSQAMFPATEIPQHLVPFTWNWETTSENLIMPKAVLESIGTWLTAS